MKAPDPGEITRLLQLVRDGDESAKSVLAALVYKDLKRVAGRLMRAERPAHTFQPTALVNEAFARMLEGRGIGKDRTHFFALASSAMRHVLVDHARGRRSGKRGGRRVRIELDQVLIYAEHRSEEILNLDEALDRLKKVDPRVFRIVELRFFGGLNEAEIADLLGISTRTVKRDWAVAKAWLSAEMRR